MLSAQDFMEKQIVIISCDELKDLNLKNENLAVHKDWKIVHQISVFKIFCIFVMGECTITTKLVSKLLDFGIWVYFLSINLKPKFLIGSQLEWNYILRHKQYNFGNEVALSQLVVKNKMTNQMNLLKEIRDKDEEMQQAIKSMKELIDKVDSVKNIDSLRWLEWNCGKLFFTNYFKVIKRRKRMPRTRADIPNLLMDIGYTFIYNFVEANLNLYGFDIYKGFYHQLFFERKSLVCDLVEPFRCLIDRQIRKMYNLWQVKEKDFKLIKGEYNLEWDNRNYYLKILISPIIENKESMFAYVKNYYRAIIKENIDLIEPFYI